MRYENRSSFVRGPLSVVRRRAGAEGGGSRPPPTPEQACGSNNLAHQRRSRTIWNEAGMSFRMSRMHLTVPASIPDLGNNILADWIEKQTQSNPLRLSSFDSKGCVCLRQNKPIKVNTFFCNQLRGKRGRSSRNMDGTQAHYSRLPGDGNWNMEDRNGRGNGTLSSTLKPGFRGADSEFWIHRPLRSKPECHVE